MGNVWSEAGLFNQIGLTQGQESNFSFSTYIQPLRISEDLLSLEAIFSSPCTLHESVFFFFKRGQTAKW